MNSKLLCFLLSCLLLASTAHAQELSFNQNPDFGAVAVNSTKRLTVTVTNRYRDQIRLDSFWLNQTDSYHVVGGTCKFQGQVLKRNKSCQMIIEFRPLWAGNHQDQMTLGYFLGRGWTWREGQLPLKGQTGSIELTSSLSFDQLEVGQTQTLTATLNNQSGEVMRLDSTWFNQTDSFQVSNTTCPMGSSLQSGQTCQFEIRFAPQWDGNHADTFSLGYFPGTSWDWVELKTQITASAVLPTTNEPPPASPWLRVVGNQILNINNDPVILKGVNIADPQHLDTKPWERPGVSARSIASMATDEYHAKVVRLPVLPGDPNYPNEGFFSETNGKEVYFKNHLEGLVQEITNKGHYVIIDLHYISDYQNLWPRVKEFWEFMAPKFANNPKVIYEVFNEPILPNNWDTWKTTIAQPAVDLIRQYAPHNLILVGGPYWSSNILGAATNPVEGTNIAYVAHIYSNQTPQMWDQRYLPVIQKHPVFITEWGFEEKGTEGGTIEFGQQFEQWLDQHKLSWTVWNFDNRWGPRMFHSDWTLIDESEGMGTFIRDLLLESHLNQQKAPSPLIE